MFVKARKRTCAVPPRIFVYALRDGAEHRHVKSSFSMHLNGQIHAKMCQNAALRDYSRKPRRLCNKLM